MVDPRIDKESRRFSVDPGMNNIFSFQPVVFRGVIGGLFSNHLKKGPKKFKMYPFWRCT